MLRAELSEQSVALRMSWVLSPEGRYVVYWVGVQLRSRSIYCVRKGILDFKNLKGLSCFFTEAVAVTAPYLSHNCFIPRRGIRSISLGVQLILFPFTGVSKSLEPFKNLYVFSFFLLQNVLFDGLDGLDGLTGWTGWR